MQPKLRSALEPQWIQHEGRDALLVRDKLGISDQAIVLPEPLAVLVSLFDGQRDTAAISAAFQLRTGMRVSRAYVDALVQQLDDVLFLDSPRYEAAYRKVLDEYRNQDSRKPSLAGAGYPAAVAQLDSLLLGYLDGAEGPSVDGRFIRGIISPHIDFARGGRTYAKVWKRAEASLREAEIIIVFGTDHLGGPGEITLTRQSYATPYGVLPTAVEVVDAMAQAIGHEEAFASELHHRSEHSIELAAVWLHHSIDSRRCDIVPVLCGSFQPFTDGDRDAARDERLNAALDALMAATRGRRTIAVAAADLAHVGPAFGDPVPLGPLEKATLASDDSQMMERVLTGDAGAFLQRLQEEGDRRRICGLPPIYMMLRFLEDSRGEMIGYEQCPADANGGSIVSITGALFY
ncbi:MAG TPA: AmmeMemoRadiSam system protein B [Chloroflexota bacterium]|nr:AmmeMemoRadiSam system protein B [Chloroflexota bacterium]